MKTYALYHLKGGVGKTTSAVNLAYFAAKEGHKTLLWDIDPQGASSYILGLKGKTKSNLTELFDGTTKWEKAIEKTNYKNLYVLPSGQINRHLDVKLKEMDQSKKQFKFFLADLKREFDYVFIDCPPNLSISAENVFRAADFVLVPMIPTRLSEYSLDQVIEFFKAKSYDDRKLIPFFNLVDEKRKAHLEIIANFRNKKRKIMRSSIPYSATLEKMSIEKAPVHHFSSKSKAASSYKNLWQELKWFRKLK